MKMEYSIEFSTRFERSMNKLKKKNNKLFIQIQKKLLDIVQKPEHYKPLRNVMAGYRRIQFGHFILVYKIEKNIIRVISLDHHDNAY
ncbi:MAG: type II toxin-antitoxin system mRNA interferase toxin, RelE/StbE family [Nanoarchaeota archaeon]|nr:type II toxin-antitoxin system mRNA interferase toxin, RelE/StbE family [Nanoarchaeota archaeon]MBU1320837.1 type II toxin-antitoxin system mRNA interferase toxin, RelE/StbE family [Nanoarchaeota archaeon]MBU1598060.1 type II toxin-antitoxin system mRNA interferase toxin, RelE/StbE family [Nanoarchaeota archaeon]MBU2441489.1 type II toxin-antitoxin system mRNA interferase toxin, RelE/StbE family [Nanoarchaeota archaeon]